MKNKLDKIAINQDGLTKHYVLYEDYKKMKQSYESKLKVLQKNTKKTYKKYDEIEIAGDKYFVLDIRENEIDICSINVLSSEDIKKYFKDKWYLSSSDPIAVRYSSNIRNNDFECSYIYGVLNNDFKEDKLKGLNIIGDVRLLTKEEVAMLDDEHRKSNDWYWTMTPYNDMETLEYGQYAYVFSVCDSGSLNYSSVNSTAPGVRPVITLSTDELL